MFNIQNIEGRGRNRFGGKFLAFCFFFIKKVMHLLSFRALLIPDITASPLFLWLHSLQHIFLMTLAPSSPHLHFPLLPLPPALQSSSQSPSVFLPSVPFSQKCLSLSAAFLACDISASCLFFFSPATCRIHRSTSPICSSSLQHTHPPRAQTHKVQNGISKKACRKTASKKATYNI